MSSISTPSIPVASELQFGVNLPVFIAPQPKCEVSSQLTDEDPDTSGVECFFRAAAAEPPAGGQCRRSLGDNSDTGDTTLISLDETDNLNVGEMDSQHQRLFALVNNLHQAMASPQGIDAVSRALEELVDFTRIHFATEEALMTRYAYPDYAKHREEHQVLLQDVGQLLQRFHDGDVLISFAIELDLEAWALRHIEVSDKPLATFLNTKGVF